MATARAETFDVETFGKLIALFDSNNAGEVEAAFRKAVLLCAKNGLRFCDAAGMAFGQDGGEASELREQLQQQEAEHASQLTEAAAEVERLRGQVAGLQAELNEEMPEGEHVIDLPGRLRRAWVFPQFRLFVLTLAIGTGAAAGQRSDSLGKFFGILCLFLFGAWSVAQFRKRGIAQMFLKWLVYAAVLMPGGILMDNVDAGNRPPVFLGVLVAALLLTLMKVSEWLGEKIRVHVWESEPVRRVRRWF